MNNKSRVMLQMLLTVISIILIIMGVTIEIYLISIGGLLLILAMLIFRGIHIRKLNKEILELREIKAHESDDPENT
ncbi:MAG: hypothetical protein DRP93_00495 [Candidatus Neomarinimicrobiota bacterium]|nr:MAG: hypothetical protein DRP93_00495 [Candidatus Neomarinimicrobiota bacterium]